MIDKLEIHEFRKFKNCTITLGKYLTAISGHNATGKSTILALLGHCAELDEKIGTPIGGVQFRTEFSQIIQVDPEKDIKSDNLMTFTIKDAEGKEIIEEFNFRSIVQSQNRYRILPVRTMAGSTRRSSPPVPSAMAKVRTASICVRCWKIGWCCNSRLRVKSVGLGLGLNIGICRRGKAIDCI